MSIQARSTISLRQLRAVPGVDGWTPRFAIVENGDERILQVVEWIGGTGTPPASGLYVGPTGFVVDIGDGVDIRGPQGIQGFTGNQGDAGWAPVFAVATDGERRVLRLDDWTGGGGTPPDVLAGGIDPQYVGAAGFTTIIGDGVDIRGPQGPQGPQGGGTIIVRENGGAVGTRGALNFIDGTNVGFTLTDDPGNNEVEVRAGVSGVLLSANNLSDVASVATARTNLGLSPFPRSVVPGAAASLEAIVPFGARFARFTAQVRASGSAANTILYFQSGTAPGVFDDEITDYSWKRTFRNGANDIITEDINQAVGLWLSTFLALTAHVNGVLHINQFGRIVSVQAQTIFTQDNGINPDGIEAIVSQGFVGGDPSIPHNRFRLLASNETLVAAESVMHVEWS